MSRAEDWTDAELGDYVEDAEAGGEPEPEARPNWNPLQHDRDEKDRDRSIVCHVCGAEHSPEVGRVLGNNDDELDRGCLDCCTIRELNGNTERVGSGAGIDFGFGEGTQR